jgi:hypothetical protein
MAQHDWVPMDATIDTGVTLVAKLNPAFDALYSTHSGPVAPPVPLTGQPWFDTSTAGTALLKIYDGTAWRTVWSMNTGTGVITFPTANYVLKTGDTMTGALLLPDGTAALPAYSFSGDPNTGVWRSAADTLALVTGGTPRLTASTLVLTGTLPLSLPAGTAAAPALMLGDTDSGLAGGNNIIYFSTSGVSRVSVSTAYLSSTLPVALPLGTAAAPSVVLTGDANTGMWSPGADLLAFSANGVEKLRIASTTLTTTVPIILPADPANPLEAATKQYVDAKVATTDTATEIAYTPTGNISSPNVQGAISELDTEKVAKAGDTMSGFLTLHADPTAAMHAATRQFVVAQTGSGLTDAPNDGATYGRKSAAWAKAVATTGDTMSGALLISGTSTSELLRVTQLGTGDAIRVEDSTNPDATPFVVSATGMVGIGVPAPTVALDMVGNVIQTGGSPYIRINKTTGASGTSYIQWAVANVLRHQFYMSGAEDTLPGGVDGSNFTMQRLDNSGANAKTSWNILRSGGEWGINGVAQAGVRLSIRSDPTAPPISDRGINLLNLSTGNDVSTDITFSTGGNTTRARIRGQRDAATNTGKMVFSTYNVATEGDVLTLDAAKTATFGGAIVGGTIQAQGIYGGGTAAEISLTPANSAAVTPPTWPTTNGGRITVLGNTHASYSFAAVACYSGSGSTGVALLPAATAWSAVSDEREKHILGGVADGLAAILAIKPIRFRYLFEDSEAPARIGFGARNVQQQIPEAVTPVPKLGAGGLPTGEERLALAPTELLPHLVRAIQQLAEQVHTIRALERRIVALEGARP